jgi:hypothetical protein
MEGVHEVSMQLFSSSQSDVPITWAHVLDQVDETLRKTEAAAADREQAIASICPSSEVEEAGTARRRQSLAALEKQMQAWPTSLRKAEREVSEAETVLRTAEEALRRWLGAEETLEQRLAQWIKPGV